MELNHCETCPSMCYRRGSVFGHGDTNSEIIIVSDMPWKSEIASGRPFTGPAGQLLWATLASLGLKEDKFFVTNACKCPIKNVKIETVRHCFPYLEQELNKCQNKKLIVAMGEKALRILLPKSRDGVMKMCGKTFHSDYFNCPILACMNPARVLQNERDFQLFRATLSKIPSAAGLVPEMSHTLPPILMNPGIQELSLMAGRPVVLDIETNSTLDYTDPAGYIESIAFTDGNKVLIYDRTYFNNPLFWDAVAMTKIIAHNGSFDLQWIAYKHGFYLELAHDTMLMAFTIAESFGTDEEGGYSLEKLACIYLGVAPWKSIAKTRGYTDAEYQAKDVYYAYLLYKLWEDRVPPIYSRLFIPLSNTKMRAELGGVTMDTELCEKMKARFTKTLDILKARLQQISGHPEYNPNSDKQNKVIFNEVLKANGIVKELKNTARDTIKPYSRMKFFRVYSAYSRLHTLACTFLTTKHVRHDGRVHASQKIHGTVTGRISMARPNLQNIPSKIRRIYIPDREDMVWLKCDYAQLEMRVALALAGLNDIIELINKGFDFHTVTAMLMTDKPANEITKDERRRAKNVNFGCLYGATDETLSLYMGKSLDDAKEFRKRYFAPFDEWKRSVEERVLKDRYVETVFGSKRRFYLVTRENILAVKREAVNTIVQGTAAQMCLFRYVQLERELRELFPGARVLFPVHDEIDSICMRKDAGDAAQYVKQVMENRFEFTDLIFSADVDILERWR